MRRSQPRNIKKPARYREDTGDESTDSNKQTVGKGSKTRDLREKLAKSKKDKCNNLPEEEEQLIYSGDSSDCQEISDEVTTDSDKDRNNNAKRIQSVVVETSSKRKQKTKTCKATISVDNETEEGEISDEPMEDINSFIDKVDDEQFAAFLA